MGKPMRIRARAEGEVVEVKILINHIMETGFRKNDNGDVIPAHFIELVTITCEGRVVLSAQWGPAVSANPFLAFKFCRGHKGETLKVTWVDNQGDSRSDEAVID
jgi:sulfur-oxidizing protein SoxZ